MRTAGCGCLLMILGFVALFAIIVIPVLPPLAEEPVVDSYLEPLLCDPGTTLVRELYSQRTFDGTNYSMNVFCDQENVTDKWTVYGIIGFLAPFLFGLLLFIGGIIARARRIFQDPLKGLPIGVSTAALYEKIANASGVTGSGQRSQPSGTGWSSGTSSPVEGIAVNDDILRGNTLNQSGGAKGNDLTARLKQLQETRDAGLITSMEYDRLRQELLDNWID